MTGLLGPDAHLSEVVTTTSRVERWRVAGLRLAGLVTVLVAARFLPEPVRGVLLFPIGISVPSVAWFLVLRQRISGSDQLRGGLALIATLALWSLVGLVILALGLGASYLTACATLLLISAMPILTLRADAGSTGSTRERLYILLPRYQAFGRSFLPYAGAFVAGSVLLGTSMSIARHHPDSCEAFAVFFCGSLLACIPVFLAATRGTTRIESALLVTIGLATYMPAFVRSPWAPNMYDELGHWGETQQLLITGRPFQPDSVVQIGPKYPGLETLAVGLVKLSGLSTISVGHLLIMLCHVSSVLGVAVLFKLINPAGGRWGLLAGSIYAIGPSYLQIDTMFAYESFAIPLAIWAIVATTEWSRSNSSRRIQWPLITLLLITCSLVTHHLTAILLSLVLVFASACCAFRHCLRTPSDSGDACVSSEGAVKPLIFLVVGICVGLGVATWATLVGAPLLSYLGRFPKAAVTGVQGLIDGTATAPTTSLKVSDIGYGQPRQIFAGSLLPGYERGLSFASQPIVFAWYCYAILRFRRAMTGLRLLGVILGAAYFLSLPLTFLSAASAGAHRSWAISYLGLALTLPLAFSVRNDAYRSQRLGGRLTGPRTKGGWQLAAAAALAMGLIGSYGAGMSAYAQFPGPFVMGADGRTISSDVVRSAEWFSSHEGRGRTIMTTSRVMAVFGAYADAQTRSFPQWEIFFPVGDPASEAIQDLLASGNDFIVVDSRLATDVPLGPYFSSFEPIPPSIPLPAASISKFEHLPWLRLIHRDTNISIYELIR